MDSAEETVRVSVRSDGESLPLFVRPQGGNRSLTFLKQWIRENRAWLDRKLLLHGAILFRGFSIEEGRDVQEAVQQYCPDLSDEYRGTSPRQLIPGTQFIFSASELPPFFPIPQHLEMSFLPSPPGKLFFSCLEAPTSAGGETCLCDFKKVYDQLRPDVRSEFEDKGVCYTRNYNRHKTFLTDPTMLKGWPEVFGMTDKASVEEELRRTGQDFSWGKGDSLRISSCEAATEPHPTTGDKIWFNHALIFHYSNMADEYKRIHCRLGGLKYLLLCWFMWLLKLLFFDLRGSARVGFHTTFGDGSKIPEAHLSHVRDVVWSNLIFNRWEKGDLLMIDNCRISHGRQPYSGRRKVVVAWSRPQLKPSHQTAS